MVDLKKIALPVTIGVGVAAAAVTGAVVLKKKLDKDAEPKKSEDANTTEDGFPEFDESDLADFGEDTESDDIDDEDIDEDINEGDIDDDIDYDGYEDDEYDDSIESAEYFLNDDDTEEVEASCGCDENCEPECTCPCHDKTETSHAFVELLREVGVTDKDVLGEINDTLNTIDKVTKKSCEKAKVITRGILKTALKALED